MLKKKIQKKAFLKTAEILLVIIITTVISISLLQKQNTYYNFKNEKYLVNLEKNPYFRDFIINNIDCFNKSNLIFSNNLPENSILCIYNLNNNYVTLDYDNLNRNIYIETVFFTGNQSRINFKIVKLYYFSD